MSNRIYRTVDFRNPKHIKIAIILIAVLGVIALTAIHYIGDTVSGAAGTDEAGDVISRGRDADDQATSSASGGDSTQSEQQTEAASGSALSEPGTVSPDIADTVFTDAAGTVFPDATGTVFIDVAGAVKSADVYELRMGSRVKEAIIAAGGLTKNADTRYINKAAILNDGDRLYIPTAEEVASGLPLPASAGSDSGSSGASPTGSGSSLDTGGSGSTDAGSKININIADASGLQTLNGVGPATAQKIIDYRTEHGAFAKIEDIKNVSGIGEKTFEKLRDRISV